MAKQGQLPHSSDSLGPRSDASCSGAVGRAYRREQVDGRQRWVVIGDYCDGCGAFWSLRELPRRGLRALTQATPVPPKQPAAEGAELPDDEIPELVRFMMDRGSL